MNYQKELDKLIVKLEKEEYGRRWHRYDRRPIRKI